MSESTTTTEIYRDASGYWKLCTIVLGVAFMIAVASHGGPSQASANEPANLLAFHQSQAAALKSADADQVLSIGGFDSIDGEAMFVIVDEQGQRVGTLPMAAMTTD